MNSKVLHSVFVVIFMFWSGGDKRALKNKAKWKSVHSVTVCIGNILSYNTGHD